MCHLMGSEKLEEQIPKLIPAILSLYKKNNEHYIISKVGMCWLWRSVYVDFVIWIISLYKQKTITLCPSVNCPYLICASCQFFIFSAFLQSESVPSSWCICQHGQQSAGDTTWQSTLSTASTGMHYLHAKLKSGALAIKQSGYGHMTQITLEDCRLCFSYIHSSKRSVIAQPF